MTTPILPRPLPKSRFFIALLPPLAVQEEITRLKEYCREVYQSGAALRSPPHITLQPPFAWLDEEQAQLTATLKQFRSRYESVPIVLSGFGAFPPRVLFVDVQHTPELMGLQAELKAYLAAQLGIREESNRDRPFHPHMTIAFRDLRPAAFRKAWGEFEQKSIQFTFSLAAITLLIHTGQRWQIHSQFSLS